MCVCYSFIYLSINTNNICNFKNKDFTNIAVDLDPLKAADVIDPSPVSRPREKPKTPTQTLTKSEFPDVNLNPDLINTTSKGLVSYASVIKV